MIGRCAASLQNLEASVFVKCGLGESIQKRLVRHMPRATAGHKEPAGFQNAERRAIQAVIASQGRLDSLFVSREFRWIEDHGVEAFSSRRELFEGFETVAFHQCQSIRDAIQFRVGLSECKCRLGHIDARDVTRPAVDEAIQREATRVTTEIQDAMPTHQISHAAAVVALVKEEAGLLSFRHVEAVYEPDRREYGLTGKPCCARRTAGPKSCAQGR